MNRPRDRCWMVRALCASNEGCLRTVSTTLVAIGTFLVSTAAAPATTIASKCLCGEADTVARSVNSGDQMDSGQKLTM